MASSARSPRSPERSGAVEASVQGGERWWGRVPRATIVQQAPMRAPQPWESVCERLCAATASGERTVPQARPSGLVGSGLTLNQ
jgi:hypothetical protein